MVKRERESKRERSCVEKHEVRTDQGQSIECVLREMHLPLSPPQSETNTAWHHTHTHTHTHSAQVNASQYQPRTRLFLQSSVREETRKTSQQAQTKAVGAGINSVCV